MFYLINNNLKRTRVDLDIKNLYFQSNSMGLTWSKGGPHAVHFFTIKGPLKWHLSFVNRIHKTEKPSLKWFLSLYKIPHFNSLANNMCFRTQDRRCSCATPVSTPLLTMCPPNTGSPLGLLQDGCLAPIAQNQLLWLS